MGRKTIRKYSASLIEVHAANMRLGIAQMNQALERGYPVNIELVQEERLLFSEMLDWLEARRDTA